MSNGILIFQKDPIPLARYVLRYIPSVFSVKQQREMTNLKLNGERVQTTVNFESYFIA